MNAANIPLAVAPEAARRLAELGFQEHAEQMIDYARQHIPQAARIEVVLTDRYDMGGPPGVTVRARSVDHEFDPARRAAAVAAIRP